VIVDQTTAVNALDANDDFIVTVIFDSVYVVLAGVSNSERDIIAPATFNATVGSSIIVYFQLRYDSDETYIDYTNTIVRINGKQASFNAETQRWEASFEESEVGLVIYEIDVFEDQYGLTKVDHRNRVPSVYWSSPPIPIEVLYLGLAVIAGIAVVLFVARTRKRVTKLEHALTPEELLSLEEVGISATMREQMVTQLEWLRNVSDEIQFTGTDVLRVLNEELIKAKQMYTRAFELESPTEPAGQRLKEMLLERIDTVLEAIEKELERR
ncbi:MAG: hypothetical protein ACFFDQ_11995, partial [Candidatus Thorarchaeota archaeon]